MTASDFRVAVTVALLAGYALLVPVVGFFTASAAFLLIHMSFLGVRKPVWLIAVTAGLLLVAWGVFEWFLNVPLPHGMIY